MGGVFGYGVIVDSPLGRRLRPPPAGHYKRAGHSSGEYTILTGDFALPRPNYVLRDDAVRLSICSPATSAPKISAILSRCAFTMSKYLLTFLSFSTRLTFSTRLAASSLRIFISLYPTGVRGAGLRLAGGVCLGPLADRIGRYLDPEEAVGKMHLMRAAAAGLIAWAFAQQLDHMLWMDHVAKLAPAIAGVPAFKEFKTSLEEVEPALLKAAERALRSRSEEAVKRLFAEAEKAVVSNSKTWRDFRKAVENVEKFGGREVRLVDAAVAWALLAAGLKELGESAERAHKELESAAEKLSRGEEATVRAKDVAEPAKKAREIAHKLRQLLEKIDENAGSGQEAFTVTETAEKLARAVKARFGELGEATLADKLMAFFESLAEGTTWSRVVLNAVEVGEAYGPLVYTPARAYDKYKAGAEGWGTWDELLTRLARALAERGVEEFKARPEGGVVKVSVGGKDAAEVEVRTGASAVFIVRGELAEEVRREALDFAKSVEKGRAKPYQARALMATDGWYYADEEKARADTTSALQAAFYRRLGMELTSANYAVLAEDDLKPMLLAYLPKGEGGEEWVELVKSDLENGIEALSKDKASRSVLAGLTLGLLGQIEISVKGADERTEEGRLKIAEVRRAIAERIEYFARLRLGEGGVVCLAGCQFGEPALTYEHEAYARVVASLLHYIAEDAPREEVLKFLAEVILYDGYVTPDEVALTVGHFGARKKKLPLDVYDKIALYIIMAAKYGVEVQRLYVGEGEARIYFNREHAAEMFAADWAELSQLLGPGKGRGLFADHAYKKLLAMKEYVEEWAGGVKIEHVVRGDKAVVYFKDEKGDELAHINIGLRRDGVLHAYFKGAKESAERLAAILDALGADAEAREYGGKWRVELHTDSITAIRRPEWLEAVRELAEKLHEAQKITAEQKERLMREIEAGPNAVEVAGVELSVELVERKEKTGKSRALMILYRPRSASAFDQAVKALKAAGFEEGLHFTAKKPDGGKQGHIYLKIPAGLWKLEELRRQGVGWAKKALDGLEEIARGRGFYDILDEYLRPAREAGSADPRGVVAEDAERGVKAVVKDVKLEWEGDRPRIVVEYETNGRIETFSFVWGVRSEGKVRASVRLDYERAAVLATLTGDDSLRGKKGVVMLYAKHLLAFARYVGWDLLWWYAKAVGE